MVNPKYLAKNADGIIAVSESTKKDLENIYGINPDKIKVIYSGLHRNENHNIANALEMKKKYQVPDKFLLYLGVIEPRKNIIGIISAFEKFKAATNNNYKLVLAGSEGWLSKKIIQKAKDSKYSQDIILYGYVTEDFKQYLMAAAAIFLFPSFYEGFGFPPLEAMAAGTPVLTSSISSLPEVCGQAAVYADPYNVNEIKEAIITMIKDHYLRTGLIKRGKNQLEKYSWKRCAQDTKEYFEKFRE
jgi:glycosyltransferase involved in cell wall biosynthesis